jgi:hypothetical protein
MFPSSYTRDEEAKKSSTINITSLAAKISGINSAARN